MEKTYNLKLTLNEIETLKSAINFLDVHYYWKNIDRAKRYDNEPLVKFYDELLNDNLTLFCKLHKAIKNGK